MTTEGSVDRWIARAVILVGLVGLLYEIVFDHLQNPTALVVFGGLAGAPGIVGYHAAVRQQVERERAIEDRAKDDGDAAAP